MKRSYRIVIAVIMMLMMVISSASMAFAAGARQDKGSAPAVSLSDENLSNAGDNSEPGLSNDEITEILNNRVETRGIETESVPIHKVQAFSDLNLAPDASLTAQQYSNGYYIAISRPVQIRKGTLYLRGYADNYDAEIAVANSDFDPLGGNSFVWENANQYYGKYFSVPSTGTYYIVTICKYSNTILRLRASLAYDLNGTYLRNTTNYIVGHPRAATTKTYKFSPKATGYMRIYTDALSKVTVCNTSGKVLARQVTVKYRPVFGVRANHTYLIKVSWPSGPCMNQLKIVNGSWWPANGVSKAKATSLSKGKIQKGLVVAGENNVRWFKFTPWQSYVTVRLTGGTNDQLVWEIYRGSTLINKGRRILTPDLEWQSTGFGCQRGATYYVKVYKKTTTSSGYYHVKFE